MRRLPVALALALGLAGPAHAVDLTGTWEEARHSTCKGLNDSGQKVALKNTDTSFGDLPLTQSGTNLFGFQSGVVFSFEGRVYGPLVDDEGQGVFAKCGGTPGVFEAYRILSAKTFPPDKNGVTGKMRTLYLYGGPSSTYSCTIDWVRTSTVDPGATGCP